MGSSFFCFFLKMLFDLKSYLNFVQVCNLITFLPYTILNWIKVNGIAMVTLIISIWIKIKMWNNEYWIILARVITFLFQSSTDAPNTGKIVWCYKAQRNVSFYQFSTECQVLKLNPTSWIQLVGILLWHSVLNG